MNIPPILFLNYMTNNTCICIIYVFQEQFRQNIKIPQQNKITVLSPIKHTSKVQQVKIEGMH